MRRAVSPVISTLMMLSIVVAFGAGIMLWSSDALNTFSISQGLFLQQSADSIKERLIIEFVEFQNTNPKSVVVHIRNVGQNHIDVDTIAIVELSAASTANIFQPTDKEVEMGLVKSFSFNFSFNSGQVYKITTMTTNGNKVIVHATA